MKKSKLLIVDDEPINIQAINQLFKEECEVFGATSGRQALEVMKTVNPDIVLLDVVMPDIDGFETLRLIKKIPEYNNIPIIFVTGLSGEDEEKKGLELGAVDFITKPIRPSITKLRVFNHLKLKHQADFMYNLSYFDGLTMISNRRFFEEALAKEWRRCSRNRSNLGILILDIDFFKQYNDTYGHIAGDECLKKVAKALESQINRAGDVVARFGGEEFVCIAPETDIKGVEKLAQKMLDAVRDLKIPHEKSSVSEFLTVSCGGTATIPEEDKFSEVFIQNADILLYKAKQSGRNMFKVEELPMK